MGANQWIQYFSENTLSNKNAPINRKIFASTEVGSKKKKEKDPFEETTKLPSICLLQRHRWQRCPGWVRRQAVITVLVAAAASWHLLLELAGCGYILIRLSLGRKHMQQVLSECTQQPKGQLCAPSVSKCIRISGPAELSRLKLSLSDTERLSGSREGRLGGVGGLVELSGFSYLWPALWPAPPLQSFHTHYQRRGEKFTPRCGSAQR